MLRIGTYQSLVRAAKRQIANARPCKGNGSVQASTLEKSQT